MTTGTWFSPQVVKASNGYRSKFNSKPFTKGMDFVAKQMQRFTEKTGRWTTIGLWDVKDDVVVLETIGLEKVDVSKLVPKLADTMPKKEKR